MEPGDKYNSLTVKQYLEEVRSEMTGRRIKDQILICECICGEEVDLSTACQEFDFLHECKCGRMYNCHGSSVNGRLRDIDPADAGEVW